MMGRVRRVGFDKCVNAWRIEYLGESFGGFEHVFFALRLEVRTERRDRGTFKVIYWTKCLRVLRRTG